jgi:hypothetical protein
VKYALLPALALAFAVPLWFAAACPIIDATGVVWPVVDSSATQSPAEQAAAFRAGPIDAFPALFTGSVLGSDSAATLDGDAVRTLARLRDHRDEVQAKARRLRDALPGVTRRFADALPDFRCDFPIYLTVSLGHFDGAGRVVGGKPALVFGVDAIGESEDQLAVFVTHELFHRYHFQAAGFSDDPGDRQPIWRTLWAEGLATYVSARLNPDRPLSDALIYPADLHERGMPLMARMAHDLLRDAKPDKALYRTYFLADAREGPIPPRAGYLVGYQVAKMLEPRYGLAGLAHLKGRKLKDEIDRCLRELAKS